MATCSVEITQDLVSGDAGSYPVFATNVPQAFSFGPSTKAKGYLNTNQQETIVCTWAFTGSPSNVTIAFFKVNTDGISVTSQGSVTTTDPTLTFQKDLSPGEYILCFSSPFAASTGTFTAVYSGYISSARLRGSAHAGEAMLGELTIKRAAKVCAEPMVFELVSGELPLGCTLGPDGILEGVMPNLDAEGVGDASPSINWFRENADGEWESVPRRWTFKAKVSLLNFPDVFAVEQFYIDIHNNWTVDKLAFMADAAAGFDRTTQVTTQVAPVSMVDASCDCVDTSQKAEFDRWVKDSGSAMSAETQQFVNSFKASTRYNDLAIMYGLKPEGAVNTINKSREPDNGIRNQSDIDSIFLQLGDKLNSKYNPLGGMALAGEQMLAEVV